MSLLLESVPRFLPLEIDTETVVDTPEVVQRKERYGIKRVDVLPYSKLLSGNQDYLTQYSCQGPG